MFPPFPSEFITMQEEDDPTKPVLYLCSSCQVYGVGLKCWMCDTADIVRNPKPQVPISLPYNAPATPSTMAQALHWALGG